MPECSASGGGRIYLSDLGDYLKVKAAVLRRWAKHQNLARGNSIHPWVTPYTAMRIISYIRAKQAAMYEAGHTVFWTR